MDLIEYIKKYLASDAETTAQSLQKNPKKEQFHSINDLLKCVSEADFKPRIKSGIKTRFLVPYLPICIDCHSELFDRVSDMSMFVLECLYNGHTID